METYFGRLGKDPELKYTKNQEAICLFSIAVNRVEEEVPIWKRIVAWGKQAELCSVHIRKGNEVFVHGQNKISKFIGRDGEEKSIEEISLKTIGFVNI